MERLLCKACEQVMVPPVWQCLEGHPLCNQCKSQTTWCPKCQVDMRRPQRNSELEELAKESESITCANQHNGCNFRGRLAEVLQHHQICEYSQPPAKCFQCNWSGLARHHPSHLISGHSAQGPFYASQSFFALLCVSSTSTTEWPLKLYKRIDMNQEKFYALNCFLENSNIYVQVISLTHKPEDVKIALYNNSEGERGSIPQLIFVGQTLSKEQTGPCLNLSFQQVLNYYSYETKQPDTNGTIQKCKAFGIKVHFSNPEFYTI